ncbi:MAG: beta-ketoacyl-[acyl-carrier-protein] synthase II, partial [Muribaculaceae bacterium]|nr:beta-ketoacyl-[acyl-carrier-protein] synthase II [Muribaculaceae bacterium]
MELKRVVVTGLGAVTPLGNDVATTWANALAGVSGAAPITHFDASKFKTQFACEVKGFNPDEHFDRKKARQLDLYAQYAIVAARQAVEDAGLTTDETLNKNRVGVIVAAGIGGLHTFEEEAGNYALNPDRGPRYNPFFIPKTIADIASGHISMEYG